MAFLVFREHKIWYNEAGAGEPMLFLHNGGNDHRIWDAQVEHFSKTNRVVVIDQIGNGLSDKPELEYTLPLYLEQIETVVRALDLAPLTLVGHCIGGAMSLAFTLQHPEKVKRLILFNVATEKTVCNGPLLDVYKGFHADRTARDQFAASLEGTMTREQTDERLQFQFGSGSPDEEFKAHIHELWNRPGQMRALYGVLSRFDTFAELDSAERPANFPPVALFWGAQNNVLPPQGATDVAARIRPDQLTMLEGCGHLAMRERPDLVNAEIEAFVAKTAELAQA